MAESKLEVPAELRDLAEKTIDQAERAFAMFFDGVFLLFSKWRLLGEHHYGDAVFVE